MTGYWVQFGWFRVDRPTWRKRLGNLKLYWSFGGDGWMAFFGPFRARKLGGGLGRRLDMLSQLTCAGLVS